MHILFETIYTPTTIPIPNNNISSHTNLNNTTRSTTRSILDADFDKEIEYFDEIEHYISEKPANKEIDVLIWWKVSNNICLL